MFRNLAVTTALLAVIAAGGSSATASAAMQNQSGGTPQDCRMGGGWTLPHEGTYTSPAGTIWSCYNGRRCFITKKRSDCLKRGQRIAPEDTPQPTTGELAGRA